ncbi:energy transducer TonB [Lysobacter xanthus]
MAVRFLAAVLPVLLAVAPAALAGPVTTADLEAPVFVTRVDGRVLIDKTGHVADYSVRTKIAEPLAAKIVELVKGVRFEPVEVDGRIVNAEAEMRVSVAASKMEGGAMRLAIDNLVFPDEKAAIAAARPAAKVVVKKVAPMYPRDALQYGVNANVLAVVRVAPDGSVRDVAVQQSALIHARAPAAVAARVLGQFEQASINALRKWRVDPAAMPSDTPRADADWVALVPVQFRLDGVPAALPAGEWTLETRTAKRVPAWVPTEARAPQPGASDLVGNDMGAPNTRYRLAAPLAALAP